MLILKGLVSHILYVTLDKLHFTLHIVVGVCITYKNYNNIFIMDYLFHTEVVEMREGQYVKPIIHRLNSLTQSEIQTYKKTKMKHVRTKEKTTLPTHQGKPTS